MLLRAVFTCCTRISDIVGGSLLALHLYRWFFSCSVRFVELLTTEYSCNIPKSRMRCFHLAFRRRVHYADLNAD